MKNFIYDLKYRLLGFLLLSGVIKYSHFNTVSATQKSRPLHFILSMAYSVLKYYGSNGICLAIQQLWQLDLISHAECYYAKYQLERNRPTIHNKFKAYLQGPHWIDKGYWWRPVLECPGALKPRLQYLKELIKHVR